MIIKDFQAEYYANKDDEKYNKYTVLPSGLAKNDSLNDSDYRVLSVLMSYFNQYNETFVSNRVLAESSNRSERSVIRTLNNLRRQGYVEMEYIRKGKEIIKRFIRPTALLNEYNEKTKMSWGGDKSGSHSGDKSGVENINSINNNNEYICVGELNNILLMQTEKERLDNRFGVDLTNRAIDHLSTYSKLSRYKNHYQTILSWVIKAVLESNPPKVLTKEQISECEKKWSPVRSKYQYDQGTETFRLK